MELEAKVGMQFPRVGYQPHRVLEIGGAIQFPDLISKTLLKPCALSLDTLIQRYSCFKTPSEKKIPNDLISHWLIVYGNSLSSFKSFTKPPNH